MLKRLIEVALPLNEISEEAAYDNRIRSGHIRTIHIWWARRPLAACRAVLFASLIPDSDDSECPESFRAVVKDVLGASEFKPKNGDGSARKDTPRNRCLEFIKQLVKWENSTKPHYIEPARKLIAAAHKIFYPKAKGNAPKVLDPFAGGGAIPLEAARIGCEAHAIDINPVAHLIELCTLVYPQKYGQPNSRPVPEYIKRLVAYKREKGGRSLFDKAKAHSQSTPHEEIVPNVEITEVDYRKNPLATDVQYWGYKLGDLARAELEAFYPTRKKGRVPLAYLWARTVKCSNPACQAIIPCIHQLWLCSKPKRQKAVKLCLSPKDKSYSFKVVEGDKIDFSPDEGTMQRGQAACPFCHTIANSKYLQAEGNAGRIGQELFAVVETNDGKAGKVYRVADHEDIDTFEKATTRLKSLLKQSSSGAPIPDEPLKAWSGVFNAPLFGMTTWGSLLNRRQALAIVTFASYLPQCRRELSRHHDADYARAVTTYLAFAIDKCLDFSSTLCRWGNDDEGVTGTFGRQALPMVWDYAESNPLQDRTGGLSWAVELLLDAIRYSSESAPSPACPSLGSASGLPFESDSFHCIVTDPPYYDAVPYSDLSDFFYVWLKRTVGEDYRDLFRTPLTPKGQEIVSHLGTNYPGNRKNAADYEEGMRQAFVEMGRVVSDQGVASVMFAHKTTSAWENLISGLVRSGLSVTASWPIHTEGRGRLRAHNSAALAGSISLVCRKRAKGIGNGLWDDVRKELREIAKERLDFFWSQGIRGADFFISAIGPALSVFGKYEQVTKLTGDEVTGGDFLNEVRSLVTNYALNQIMKTTQIATIDPESRFYVIWKWSYGEVKVPADESFKMAQALGIDTELMWDRTGVLEKSGENVQAVPVAKRMKIKNLGEPDADAAPASLIDVLHRMCVFRDKGDTEGMTDFLARSRQGRNPNLWLLAQAVSEILPDGDKEKQLMQGLLNQRDNIEEEARKGKLF